jgi:NAD(P)-dependent dehydrogenase (short-subunit alcohol dehydrogenase family)
MAAEYEAELIRRAYVVGPDRSRPSARASAGSSVSTQGAEAAPGLRLLGKSALITGAAHGIGWATAELFAREGARLVLSDRDGAGLSQAVEALASTAASVESIQGDVSHPADARRMIDTAVRRHGRLDVLVANAGIIPFGTVLEATPEDWDQVMAVDARGMFLTCKYAVEAMLRNGGGSIVCLSSISGIAGQSQQAAYGPAKFVASGLTKHLAVEWAARGIRVNAVAPGTIKTDRVRMLADEPGGKEYLDSIRRMHPMGRLGEPSEVAQAILFLASDEASFITGVILPVDGGYLAQ